MIFKFITKIKFIKVYFSPEAVNDEKLVIFVMLI